MHLSLQRFLVVALTASLMVVMLGAHPAEAARKKKNVYRPQPDRFAEIIIEASSGYVLSEKNADKRLYPASLTKMMTLYLTFEALQKGTLSRSQRAFVSKRAASQEPSSLGLQTGDALRVEDAILAIATKSANDCAVVLAEAIGGSEENFARLMTSRARQLGMKNTHFVNASGLYHRNQYSTARDIAVLAQALIRDYPRYYRYFSTESFTYAGNTYINHNKLMSTYQGMDGLKTGYVNASGYNLAASAVRNGTRLIGVVFGGKTAKSRNNVMAQLLNNGFSAISDIRVASLAQKNKPQYVPSPRPVIPVSDSATEVTVDNPSEASLSPAPQFDSLGLEVEQGDTNILDDSISPAAGKSFVADFQPRSLNTTSIDTAPAAKRGDWSIQVGAFASREAGQKALNFAKSSLRGAVHGKDSIAPLMTNRGMIYRARLSGLARNDATKACRILKGNCLILTVE